MLRAGLSMFSRCRVSSLSFHHQMRLASSVATVRLYRILLRHLQALPQDYFLLQPPLNPRDYGRARLVPSSVSDKVDSKTALFQMFTLWYTGYGDDTQKDDQVLSWYRAMVGRDFHQDREGHVDEFDTSLWTTRNDIKRAVQAAFRTQTHLSSIALQRLAILAIQSLQSAETVLSRTSTTLNDGLRVVATSSCIGTASSGSALVHETKHRFAYRIRIENLPGNDKTVQLLGRTWKIQEHNENGTPLGDAVTVNAPTTGAVGHLPVILPGLVFEYMSGCELASKTGNMGGLFHMALVDDSTPSAMVGDPIDAFQKTADKFELVVQPFPLVADDG